MSKDAQTLGQRNEGETGARRRLVERAKLLKISLEDLSENIGRARGYLRDYVKRGSPQKLDIDDCEALAKELGTYAHVFRDRGTEYVGPSGDLSVTRDEISSILALIINVLIDLDRRI